MKRITLLCLMAAGMLLLEGCGPKPQYKTREGKRKLKYYNSVQYQEPAPAPQPAP